MTRSHEPYIQKPRKRPPLRGQQDHKYTEKLRDAHRHLVNASQAFATVANRARDPEEEEWAIDQVAAAEDMMRMTTKVERMVRERLREFTTQYPEQARRAWEGYQPYPDEKPEYFTPRHTCKDRCLFHHTKAGRSTLDDCNCDRPPCLACQEAA